MSQLAPSIPIVDLDLARRLERAEGMANRSCVESRANVFPESGACWIEVAGTLAMFDGAQSPISQTFGLGLFADVQSADLDQLESFFLERGATVQHEVCPLVDQALLRSLGERGYRPFEWSTVLIRRLDPADAQASIEFSRLRVRLIEPHERELWARLSTRGWVQDPALEDFMFEISRIVAEREGSLCFIAELDGQPIATGGLFVHEGVALFAGASTVPESRGQGAQRALFAARLRYVQSIGCDLAVVVTLPGSLSERNAQKSGFRPAYTRTKWLLAR